MREHDMKRLHHRLVENTSLVVARGLRFCQQGIQPANIGLQPTAAGAILSRRG